MQPEEKEFQKSLWQQFESVLDRPSASALHRAAACRGLLQRVNVAYAFHQLNGGSAFQLLQKYGEKYASILDSRDQETGLDNHIAHIVALGGRQKMENKQWHSSLTLDCLRNMECVSNFLKGSGTPSRMIGLCHWEYPETTDGYSSEAVPRNTKMGDAMEGVIADPNSYCNSDRFCVGSTNSSLESSDVHFTSAMSFKRTKKPLTVAAASFTNAQNLVAPEPAVPFVLRNANMQVKRKACEVSDNADLSDEQFEEIDSKSERNNRVATNTFKTARQQLATVQAKRQGRNTVAAQGLSKKSLGTAKPRGPFGRFVSPVLKSEGSEGSTNMCAKEYDANGDQCFDEQLKNVDSKMVDVILGEILDRGPPVDWDDISGLDFAKATIKEIVVWPMLRPDIFTGLRGPPKGLLLFGPPGTGKTLIGKCIASQSGATFFSVSASTLTSKWVGEGEKLVKALFAVAHARQPAVIFVDEIDALLSRRRGDGTEHEASRRMKTEFLVQMDGAATEAEDRVLVVGATNRPQEIDEAARRRLAKRLYIPLPCAVARRGIVQKLLEQQQCSVGEQDFRQIVERSEGFSGADVSLLCREAAMGPVRELSDIATVSADTMRSIEYRDFDTALSVVRPSVSFEDLEVYVNWDKQFGCGR